MLVLLDGDGCIVLGFLWACVERKLMLCVQFNRSFISRGRDGGREAALALTRQVMTLADKELGRSVQILCQVYYNKNGLAKVLNVRFFVRWSAEMELIRCAGSRNRDARDLPGVRARLERCPPALYDGAYSPSFALEGVWMSRRSFGGKGSSRAARERGDGNT